VKNAAGILRDAILSIRRVEYPSELIEIVVVDNGSTDASPAVAGQCDAVVFHEPQPGPYAARNLGAQKAKGDVLAFTDADCRVHPGWARALARALERYDAVCGLSLGSQGGAVSRLVQQRYAANLRDRRSSSKPLPVFDTRNAATSRAFFTKVGGFDARLEDLADDIFGIQVVNAGGVLGFSEEMIVEHVHPERLIGVFRRQRRHGRFIPYVRAMYGKDVTESFPGIDRYAWMYKNGFARRLGSMIMLATAAGITGASGVVTQLCMMVGLDRASTIAFDLFCRGGTVWGMAEVGITGIERRET
jgi:glycosyltransferase involved in cell wall biosynthesis